MEFFRGFSFIGICRIENEKVSTFDNLDYKTSIADCDQVVAKDCSGRYNFAVLTRYENKKTVRWFRSSEDGIWALLRWHREKKRERERG